MTIAISVKIYDGVVLATDSASTVIGTIQQGGIAAVSNIYNNANKAFNLRKGFRIGAVTWGAGGLGNASISTLVKDLRGRFSGRDSEHKDWELDENTYTVELVANQLRSRSTSERLLSDRATSALHCAFERQSMVWPSNSPRHYPVAQGLVER